MEQDLIARGCLGNSWQTLLNDLMLFFAYLTERADVQCFFRILYTEWEHTEENRAIRLIWEKYEALWKTRIREVLENARSSGDLAEHVDIDDTIAAIRAVQWGLTGSWSYLRSFDLLKVGEVVLTGVLKELQMP